MSSVVTSPAQPEQILKGLSKVWTTVGKEEKQQGKPTVLRACAMTLIVATNEADGGEAAAQTITELMHEHPNRGVVLAIHAEQPEEPEAQIRAQFWKPFGKAQQIGCEQIEIKARPNSWPSIGPILLGLTVADLPVVFWCRQLAALCQQSTDSGHLQGLETVMGLATKTIVDTRGLNAIQAFELLSKWRAKGYIVADLEWTRLTPWREPLGHVFDNAARENKFSSFRTIELSHSDETPTTADFYMAGWLSAPFGAKVVFKRVEGYGPGLHSIALRSDRETITFERTGQECLRIHSTNGRDRRFSYSDPAIAGLMNEELTITGVDPVFESAFARAAELLHEQR